jgi:hypothetical protein
MRDEAVWGLTGDPVSTVYEEESRVMIERGGGLVLEAEGEVIGLGSAQFASNLSASCNLAMLTQTTTHHRQIPRKPKPRAPSPVPGSVLSSPSLWEYRSPRGCGIRRKEVVQSRFTRRVVS